MLLIIINPSPAVINSINLHAPDFLFPDCRFCRRFPHFLSEGQKSAALRCDQVPSFQAGRVFGEPAGELQQR